MFPFLKNMISVFILEFNDRGALWRTQNAQNMADPKVRSGSVFTLRSLSDLPLMSYPKRTESVSDMNLSSLKTVYGAADNEDIRRHTDRVCSSRQWRSHNKSARFGNFFPHQDKSPHVSNYCTAWKISEYYKEWSIWYQVSSFIWTDKGGLPFVA